MKRRPHRLVSSLALVLLPLGLLACASATTGVNWQPRDDAPTLPSRGDGCYVEVYETGKEPTRPYQVVGKLRLKLDRDELASGGGQGVAQRFKRAACEYGVFLVTDIKAFPDATRGGAEYEAKGAVYLDDEGRPILVRSGNEGAAVESAADAAVAGASDAPADEASTGDADTGAP